MLKKHIFLPPLLITLGSSINFKSYFPHLFDIINCLCSHKGITQSHPYFFVNFIPLRSIFYLLHFSPPIHIACVLRLKPFFIFLSPSPLILAFKHLL